MSSEAEGLAHDTKQLGIAPIRKSETSKKKSSKSQKIGESDADVFNALGKIISRG